MRFNFTTSQQVRQVVHSARREVLIVLSGTRDLQIQDAPEIVAAKHVVRSGLSVKVFVSDECRFAQKVPESVWAELARHGIDILSVDDSTPRMIIIDGAVVVLADEHGGYDSRPLIGRDLPFTRLLVKSVMKPGDQPQPQVALDPPEPLEREVLRQLVKGAKDEVGARELGLALRTYRRVVARLMGQLDARSRFEAGYRAARSEWL